MQVILVGHEPCDTYNMDEAVLYWREAPITNRGQPGVKQNKSA